MALGLKRWTAVAAVACAAVAVWQLPPAPFTSRVTEQTLPPLQEQARFNALAGEAVRARALLRQLAWSDSLSAHLVEHAEDGWAVEIQWPDAELAVAADSLRTVFRGELGALPNRRSDVVLGAFVQDRRLGDHAADWGALTGRYVGRTAFFGRRGDRVYCFQVDPAASKPAAPALLASFSTARWDEVRRYNMLGICRWVAELGLPGEGILRWLQLGAASMAVEGSSLSPDAREAEAGGRLFYYEMPWRRGPFGVGGDPSDFGACRAGRVTACERLFSDPARATTPWGFVLPRSWGVLDTEMALTSPGQAWIPWRTFGFRRSEWQWLLADLYREFGPERMEAFWSSDADPVTAFRDAFGLEAGAWVTRWARGQRAYSPPGPVPRVPDLMWALAVIAAGAGLAALAGRRRTVSS